MKKVLYIALAIVAGLSFTACNLDTTPDDELSSNVLLQDESGAEYIMDGCYALLKDQVEYLGYSSGNEYCRHYFQMSEFPADNICLSAKTTDPLYEATAYMMTDNLKNVGTLWMLAYKVIYMCNTVIETLKDKPEAKQLTGEAYFMRGMMHFHLVTLFAKPYSQGTENLGVPLRTSTNSEVTIRNSVGDVYDQIVADLIKAAELMGPSRGNKGYPSHDAALGLLSRVYLYMGKYTEVVNTVNDMLNGADPASKLEPSATFPMYFANAKTSVETLFCIAHEVVDDKGQASGGSMYNGDGGGWGEIYPSAPLMDLFERYPSDLRYTSFIVPQYPPAPFPNKYVYFPDPESPDDASGRQVLEIALTAEGEHYFFMDGSNKCVVEPKVVNGEYIVWHVVYRGVDCDARVLDKMKHRTTDNNPTYYVTKFGYQDGVPTLSSPVYCRWGEVILNRAEAEAKLGQDDAALKDVNIMRTRAGIPDEGLFGAGKMHGYASAFDVVMDERRLELCFEGHRMFDVYRNGLSMNRQYPGAQPWAIVPCDFPKIQYPIPNSEWTVSGIQQNPGY